MKAGIQELTTHEEYRNLRHELKFLVKHAVSRSYQLEFYKCDGKGCDYCTGNPINSKDLFESLSKTGGRLATPTMSEIHLGHYKAALDYYGYSAFPKEHLLEIDEGLPSLQGNRSMCNYGCAFIFRSNASKLRHEILFHLEQRKKAQKRAREERCTEKRMKKENFVCRHKSGGQECGYQAKSQYYLRKHKDECGHKK